MNNENKQYWLRSAAWMIVVVIGAAVACGATPAKSKGRAAGKKSGTTLEPTTYDPRVSLAPLVEKVSPAVVNISTSSKIRQRGNMFPGDFFEWFFGPRGQIPRQRPGPVQQSLGSGFIIKKNGLLVTNHHVVDGADEIEVTLADDRTFKADLVGSDQRTDVAVLRIKGAKNLPTVSFGDSDKLKVGDHVVAIGNPFGLDHTVTSGIVSAKERNINITQYDDFIQTDASINPGNSGGPLFNLKGEVIGINTAINPQGQGIGFAIPSNLALGIIDSLSEEGKVVRGWLGIGYQALDEKLAKAFGVESKNGAVVSEVTEDSPAEKGGFLEGDVIIAVNGKKLKSGRQLAPLVANLKPGQTATFKIIRKGKNKELKVKIGEMPPDIAGYSSSQGGADGKSELGFAVGELDSRTKKRLDAEDVDGVVITQVDSSKKAARVLTEGDIIVEVNQKKIKNVGEFNKAVSKLKEGDDLLLRVYRGGAGWRYVVIRL